MTDHTAELRRLRKELRDMLDGNIQFHEDPHSAKAARAPAESMKEPSPYDWCCLEFIDSLSAGAGSSEASYYGRVLVSAQNTQGFPAGRYHTYNHYMYSHDLCSDSFPAGVDEVKSYNSDGVLVRHARLPSVLRVATETAYVEVFGRASARHKPSHLPAVHSDLDEAFRLGAQQRLIGRRWSYSENTGEFISD